MKLNLWLRRRHIEPVFSQCRFIIHREVLHTAHCGTLAMSDSSGARVAVAVG
jgi:hypothetical protein